MSWHPGPTTPSPDLVRSVDSSRHPVADRPDRPGPDGFEVESGRPTRHLATLLPLAETLLKVFLATAIVTGLFGIGSAPADLAGVS